MRRFIVICASWFGSGYSPWAPGTAGTLAAIPLYLVLSHLPLVQYVVVTTLFTLFACFVSWRAEEVFGAKDPGIIVIDEVAGFLVTMAGVPLSAVAVAAGFFLFRFFDVTKIPPARWFDRKMKNGVGVVLDDVVAGAYSCMSLHLLMRYL